jgi:hypothetical protein
MITVATKICFQYFTTYPLSTASLKVLRCHENLLKDILKYYFFIQLVYEKILWVSKMSLENKNVEENN